MPSLPLRRSTINIHACRRLIGIPGMSPSNQDLTQPHPALPSAAPCSKTSGPCGAGLRGSPPMPAFRVDVSEVGTAAADFSQGKRDRRGLNETVAVARHTTAAWQTENECSRGIGTCRKVVTNVLYAPKWCKGISRRNQQHPVRVVFVLKN